MALSCVCGFINKVLSQTHTRVCIKMVSSYIYVFVYMRKMRVMSKFQIASFLPPPSMPFLQFGVGNDSHLNNNYMLVRAELLTDSALGCLALCVFNLLLRL